MYLEIDSAPPVQTLGRRVSKKRKHSGRTSILQKSYPNLVAYSDSSLDHNQQEGEGSKNNVPKIQDKSSLPSVKHNMDDLELKENTGHK